MDGRSHETSVWHGSTRALCGIAGALAIHALVFQATLMGATARKANQPELQGPGAAAFASSAPVAMTLVFVQTSGVVTEAQQQFPELASRGKASADSPLTITAPIRCLRRRPATPSRMSRPTLQWTQGIQLRVLVYLACMPVRSMRVSSAPGGVHVQEACGDAGG